MILRTDGDLRNLKPGRIVIDSDGDYMIKGSDGYMHQLSEQEETSPCWLPATLLGPDRKPTTFIINEDVRKCYACGK